MRCGSDLSLSLSIDMPVGLTAACHQPAKLSMLLAVAVAAASASYPGCWLIFIRCGGRVSST